MTSPLTPERKQEMRERIEKATKGPWWGHERTGPRNKVVYRGICAPSHGICHAMSEGDQDFVVHAHTDLPDLLESHEALVEALKKSDHLANCNAAIYQDGCGRGKKDDCYWLDYLCAIHSPDGFVCDCGRDAALRNAGVQS